MPAVRGVEEAGDPDRALLPGYGAFECGALEQRWSSAGKEPVRSR
ncbi:hypothetical protein [Streptomyces parvus]